MQSDGAVAIVNVVEMLYEIAGLVVSGVVPLIAGTSCSGKLMRRSRADGEREGDGAVATVRGLQMQGVGDYTGSRRRQVKAVFRIAFAQADGTRDRCGGRLVHHEIQYGGAVAAMHIRVDDAVVSGDRGLLDVESMQLVRIAKADGIGERVAFFREYREIQREGAVSAIYSLQGIIINTRSGQDFAVKVIAAVETDGCVEVGVVSWMHRELQRSGAVASMDARIDVGHRIVASHRDGFSPH